MSDKSLYYLAGGIGATIGGFIPDLWHAGVFSLWGAIFSVLAGIGGIWGAYKLLHG